MNLPKVSKQIRWDSAEPTVNSGFPSTREIKKSGVWKRLWPIDYKQNRNIL